MTRFPRYRATALAGLVAPGLMALGLLAGCSNSEPENQPVEAPEASTVSDAPSPAPDTPLPTTVAQPTGLQPPEIVPEVAPVEPTPPDAQVLEDADATGMTARVRRDEATPAPTDDDTPAPSEPSPAGDDTP